MNLASRNVLGFFFALAVVGLIGWISASALGHRDERVGVIELTPAD